MSTLDAMKQAIKELHNHTESEHWRIAQASTCIREAIAHEEAMAAKPTTERDELVRNLREHSDERLYEEADLLMHEAANMLEQDGKDLADVGDELTVAYMQGHSKGVEVGKTKAQQVVVPQGWKLVAVNQGFDDLMYWLNRCQSKGHLEKCADLVEPWDAFDYHEVTPQPPQEQVQQDAKRYRWVRDTGNENWMPLVTRWCGLGTHCDEYIDAEIAKAAPQPPQGEK